MFQSYNNKIKPWEMVKILLFVLRFEVLMALSIQSMVFWEMTLHSLIDGYQCFCLEDVNNRFLRNADTCLPKHMVSYPIRPPVLCIHPFLWCNNAAALLLWITAQSPVSPVNIFFDSFYHCQHEFWGIMLWQNRIAFSVLSSSWQSCPLFLNLQLNNERSCSYNI